MINYLVIEITFLEKPFFIMGEHVSRREFARRQGWAPSYVIKQVHLGIIPVEDDDKIDVDKAIAAIRANQDPSKDHVRDRHAQNRNQQPPESGAEPAATDTPAQDDDDDLAVNDNKVVSYQDAKTKREFFQAKQARIDYLKKADLLAGVDAFRKEAFNSARVLRDALLTIADRQAQVLAAETDPVKVHEILETEITTVLNELFERYKSGTFTGGGAGR